MSLKKPYHIRAVDVSEAPQINQNYDRLYSTRVEGLKHTDVSASAVIIKPYQSFETGIFTVSATGSPVVAKVLVVADSYKDILHVNVQAIHSAIIALVTDVTQSSIFFDIRAVDSATNLSAITTATVKVHYMIIGANP